MRYVELYRFARPDGQVWRYTAAEATEQHEGFDYSPLPLGRSGLELGPELERSRVEISLPASSDLGQEARVGFSEQRLDCTIYRRVDTTTTVIWQGAIVDVRWEPATATLIGQPQAATIRQLGLRLRYGRGCRWALYSAGCGVLRGDFEVPATVDEVLGTTLTINEADALPDGWFTGGFLQHPTLGRRYIRSHTGFTVELVSPVPGLAPGDEVQLYPGCDHTIGTCDTKFGNARNFGGFPWIPTTDPHGRRLR